ncbi:MAG: Amidohydrolase [Lentisphaerae bacterium ADurb.BinA184]|nr:MAG: Amidohydrolase [Lentisphaerae bacterium ADurb.BinA184]
MELDFFDCNVALGLPMVRPATQHGAAPATASALLAAMDRAGVRRALVWHVAQHNSHPITGNQLLAAEIAGHERLAGCWAILPNTCGELGDLDAFFAAAYRAGVRALRAFPGINRYLLRREAVGEILDRMVAGHWPLILRVPADVGWEQVYDLMAATPDLTLVLASMGVWGSDRLFRPLLDRYPNVCIETGGHIVDGGIEDVVARYGAGRLLFGSGFPDQYLGAMMLALAHAEIREADKRAIAGGNLDRLLAEVRP